MNALSAAAVCLLLYLNQVATLQNGGEELFSKIQTNYNDKYDMYEMENQDPEVTMTMNEIIRYHGYPVENYDVQTADGFIITVQRIPYGKNGPGTAPRNPVIIQHGLTGTAAVWIVDTPNKNLPYILADEGYDVWLTNVRGTDYGRKHVSLTPKDKEYWQYSWDEMAEYDMPAMIDFILQHTGFDKTFYIGHSMGTTIGFAMLASKPEYNSKIRGLMALAPVAYVDHMRSPIKLLAPFAGDIGFLVTLLGNGEFLTNTKILDFFTSGMCSSPIKLLCSSIQFILSGFNIAQLNATRLPVYTHLSLGGSSVQNVIHYAQEISSHRFCKQDFGFWENKHKYGQGTPPAYRIDNIKAPVATFWSDHDLLADPEDVARLAKQLPNLVLNYRVPDPKFSHIDFMWAIDVQKLLYDRLVSKMKDLSQD